MDLDKLNRFAQSYAKAWCSQDPGRIAAFFSEDGLLKVNDATPAVGRAAIAEVARGFMRDFPDLKVTMNKIVCAPEGAEFHWTLVGTNTAPGGTGRRVRISGYEQWRLGSDGLIRESKGHFDSADYERQLQDGTHGEREKREF